MTELNKLLLIPSVQAAVWEKLHITCPLPVFDAQLWYGFLSGPIHVPNFAELYVDKADVAAFNFFTDLQLNGILKEKTVVVTFDAEEAAMGRKHRTDRLTNSLKTGEEQLQLGGLMDY